MLSRISVAVIVLSTMVACSDSADSADSVVTIGSVSLATTAVADPGTSATVLTSDPTGPSSDVPISEYEVRDGDALFSIASRHCTTADAIALVNAWSDGLDHVIHPGDVLMLLSGSCVQPEPTSTTQTSSSTESTEAESAEVHRDNLQQVLLAFNPDRGDTAGQFSDPTCTNSYFANLNFELGEGTKAAALAGLTELSIEVPASATDRMTVWDKFVAQYRDAIVRITATFVDQGEEVALVDPAVDEIAVALRKTFTGGGLRGTDLVNTACAQFQLDS